MDPWALRKSLEKLIALVSWGSHLRRPCLSGWMSTQEEIYMAASWDPEWFSCACRFFLFNLERFEYEWGRNQLIVPDALPILRKINLPVGWKSSIFHGLAGGSDKSRKRRAGRRSKSSETRRAKEPLKGRRLSGLNLLWWISPTTQSRHQPLSGLDLSQRH